MPIRIPKALPAFQILQDEGVTVISESAANMQDIRPLKIALLNLMPMKIETETHFARVIGSTPLQIDLTLVNMNTHISKNTPSLHMKSFYKNFSMISDDKFDGLLITGAPIEHLEFEQVDYWEELKEIFDWTQTNIHSTMAVCWGAMAMMYFFHQIPKYSLQKKVFGCYDHDNIKPQNRYMRGFNDIASVPVSRWSEVRHYDLKKHDNLEVILSSDEVGPCLIEDHKYNSLYMFNHLEYDTLTLNKEYIRDKALDASAMKPVHYFPENNALMHPINSWRSHGQLLYGNWINEIYQTTPYNIQEIKNT